MGAICQHHHSLLWWKEQVPWEAIKIPPKPWSQQLCSETVNLWAVKCHPHLKQGVLSLLPLHCQIWGENGNFGVFTILPTPPVPAWWSVQTDPIEGKNSQKLLTNVKSHFIICFLFYEILSFTFEGSFICFQGCLCEHEQL